MTSTDTINEQITGYLQKLNHRQKKAVLTVVKTFADEQTEHDHWQDESFLAELEVRTSEYESGKAELYTLDELEAAIRNSYKAEKMKA